MTRTEKKLRGGIMEMLEAVLLINKKHYTTKIYKKEFEEILKNKDYKIIGKPSIVNIDNDKYARLYQIQYKKEFRILVYDTI